MRVTTSCAFDVRAITIGNSSRSGAEIQYD